MSTSWIGDRKPDRYVPTKKQEREAKARARKAKVNA